MGNYTVEEQKQHREELADALLYGGYEQVAGRLRLGDKFCCLGVACEISGLGDWSKTELFAYVVPPHGVYSEPHSSTSVLPLPVMDYYGFREESGVISYEESLTSLNDRGVSFADIAEDWLHKVGVVDDDD